MLLNRYAGRSVRHRLFLFLGLLLGLATGSRSFAQIGKTHTLSCYVREAGTEKPLSGVSVFVQELRSGVTTDREGYYLIAVPTGTYSVQFTHVGFLRQVKKLTFPPSQLATNILLESDTKLLDEVTVKTEGEDRNVRKLEMGVSQLPIRNIKRMPALMGEVDVVRSLLLLPGVTTVGEGATGINVRGGSVDQNLVLLDDAPIYNSSHLFGFFSVFNPEAVRDVTLQKGSLPARYGGRASSVLDVRTKEPETERLSVRGGVGLVASRLGIEGPIAGRKLSFLADARLSANNFLFKIGPPQIRDTRAKFYDLTAKVKYLPNEKNTIWVTAYASNDDVRFPSDSLLSLDVNAASTQFDYQTTNGSVRWNHAFSDDLTLTVTGVMSQYASAISVPSPASNAFRLQAYLNTLIGKAEFAYQLNKHKITAGANMTRYDLSPNTRKPGPSSNVLAVELPREQGIEAALYAEDELNLSKGISALVGLRYTQYLSLGPGDVSQYGAEGPRQPENVTSQRQYGRGDVMRTYGGLEPRLALRFGQQSDRSVKVSYTRMRQFLHLITNTTAAMPTDRWKLSDTNIRPQVADQVSAGYFRNLSDNTFELSGEVYYKHIQDAIEYRDGAQLLLNPRPETDLLQGTGRAYGLELMAKKNKGFWTGWASYAYSRSLMLVNGPFFGEQINNGRWFPANFDKPHTVNLLAIYRPTLAFSASFNFTYSTGRPITAPYAKARINGAIAPIFLDRNQQRIPDYHRLDMSLTWEKHPDKPGRFWYSWVFSVYNLYARKNAYSVFYKLQSNSQSDAYKLAIFGSAIPSLTYNFKF